jgi:glucosyl-3-phosphoglycerate phosphatase
MFAHDLYILRHGETVWNREGRLQGALDSALTDHGVAQARCMGRALMDLSVGPATYFVFSSHQGRAMATAQAMFGAVSVTADPRLAEIGMGDWSGLTRTDIDRIWPGDPDEPMFSFYARCPKGERFQTVWDRAASFLADLTGPAVIVTHGMTSRFLRAAALGQSPLAAETMPGGQGVIYHLSRGVVRAITPPDLPAAPPGAMPLV